MSNKKTQTFGESQVLLEDKVQEPRKARVLLLNDDYTSMDFVVRILLEVFYKTIDEATAIMLKVHEKGQGECGVYPIEVAETKVSQVHGKARSEGFPLRCMVEII